MKEQDKTALGRMTFYVQSTNIETFLLIGRVLEMLSQERHLIVGVFSPIWSFYVFDLRCKITQLETNRACHLNPFNRMHAQIQNAKILFAIRADWRAA